LVVEEAVELGGEYEVEIGEHPESRGVRIVWVQDEADGQIVGIQFLDGTGEGSVPPPPSSPDAAAKSKT
jgi:hypothetical protein